MNGAPGALAQRREPIPLLILGSRIFAEEVADLVVQEGVHELAGFVENLEQERCNSMLLGLPVHWIDDLGVQAETGDLAETHQAVCAISTNKRRAFVEQIASLGFQFARIRHPSAVVSPASTIGSGCVISAGVVIGTSSDIGEQTILNRGVLIGHHTTVGRFVTISPGANIAGCVSIGDGAYIGMGATVLDRMEIGAGALVGAGSLVTKSVPAGTQVMGVPARVIRDGVQGR